MLKKVFLIAISLVITIACDKTKNSDTVSEGVPIVVNPDKAKPHIQASSMFSDIEYVPLETPDEHLIGEIAQILFYKNRFYILDNTISKSVFCFQKDGKFLFEIDRKGNGPGEYVSLETISINDDQDQLLLYCGKSHQIIAFDLDGTYIQSYPLDFYASFFSYIGDGFSAFSCNYNPSNSQFLKDHTYPNLIITDSNFKAQSVDLPFSENINFSAILNLSCCFSPVTDHTTSMITSYNDTIYHITKNKLEKAYYFDFGKKNKNKDFYDLMTNAATQLGETLEFANNNDLCNIFHLAESDRSVFFVYSEGSQPHIAYYDKQKKSVQDAKISFAEGGLPSYPVNNDIDGAPFSVPYFTDGKLFYGFMQPNDLLQHKETIEQSKTPNKQKLLSLFDRISEYDNPIISIITPK